MASNDELEARMEAAIAKQFGSIAPKPEPTSAAPDLIDVQPEDSYDFEGDFQERIAALTLRDASFVRRTEGLIKPEYFQDSSQATLVAIAQEYYDKYRTTPRGMDVWAQLLRDNVVAKRVRNDMIGSVARQLDRLIKLEISDSTYISDKVSDFARTKAVQRAMLKSHDLMSAGKIDEAQNLLDKAFRVGAVDDSTDYDYWNDIERRTQYRKDRLAGLIKPDGIPTGITMIDKLLYHRGWGRKEISVIMGGAKKGKSMGLGEFAIRASRLGYNALYVSLEVASEIIMDRMDANVSATNMDELDDQVVHIADRVKGVHTHGELRIKQFASGSLSPRDLRRVIERYRNEGIIFDLIVVDYADIMTPDNPTYNEIQDSKQVWLGLRAIAFEECAALLTATQTNREGFTASTAKAEHAAEDFNKIRIADLVISVNRSEEETRNGEARLFFAASRNQAGEVCLKITQDMAKMKFIKTVVGFA